MFNTFNRYLNKRNITFEEYENTYLNILEENTIQMDYRNLKNHAKTFRQYLLEATDRLDISIQAATKWLTSDKRKQEFISSPVQVELKFDGAKINLIYKDNTGDFTKDWIVSYKGEIQYPKEFDFAASSAIKKSSIANAQFKLVFDHLQKITPSLSGIPKDTEFFIEMLMKKPTLSSNYTKHGMILIASSPCTWTDNMGILKTSSTFDTSNRLKYSKILNIPAPTVIFEGILGNQSTFESSVLIPELKALYNSHKNSIKWDSPDSIIQNVSDMFLSLDSKYGNHKEEGVVIIFKDGSKILKFQQPYQVDQVARALIKAKFKEPSEDLENIYWDRVRLSALNIIQVVTRGNVVKYVDFPDTLAKCAEELKSLNLDFKHSKKNILQIKDDINGQIKLQLRKSIQGNNGSLILGRFQPLTLGHVKMIKQAEKESDKVVICVVRAKKEELERSPLPYDLQVKMISKVFPKADIITHSTGNIFSIMQKSPSNINMVWSGTDRYSSYKNTLKFNPEIRVMEIKRSDSDISATKVRQAVKDDDEKTFKKMMPGQLWSLFDELKKYIK